MSAQSWRVSAHLTNQGGRPIVCDNAEQRVCVVDVQSQLPQKWQYDTKCAKRDEFACLIAAAPDILELVYQYQSDLRHPPTSDSVERRLERIAAVLAKVGGA